MEDRPQYHHYIPRFVLRNFVQAEESKTKDTGKHNYPNRDRDGVIPYYDLDNGQLGFRRLSKAYGVTDMYRDISLADTNHIEKLLSKLESKAAKIIQKIQKAHKERQPTVELLRRDLHVLRKFLYVMEHRSKTVRRRFTGTIEEYEYNDKAQIAEYIKKRGFKKPTEVWLESLRLVLEAEDSADGVGYDQLEGKMYADDYGMFRHALENFHICICEPKDPDMEFIISDNGFSVFEGNIILNNPANNNPLDHKAYIEYHKIATLSPRLAIVLRSNIFREGNERKKHVIYQIHSPSPLEDMPVHGAVPRYVNLQMPGGWTRPVASLDDIEFSMLDSYTLKIYKIPKKHVLVFNRTHIEEAKHSLTFCSKKSMAESLRNHAEHTQAPIVFWSNPKLSNTIRIWSAKARLLSILDASSTKGPELKMIDSAKYHSSLETTKGLLQNTNYIKLTKGSIDMYSFDMFQAMMIDRMRVKIITLTKKMEQEDATAIFRNFTDFLCEFIDTKTLLISLHMKYLGVAKDKPVKKDRSEDSDPWMLPTRAEECIFELWGNPRVSTKEFNTLLYEAMRKEDFRKTAAAGIRMKSGSNKMAHIQSLIGAECYATRQYGSIKEWAFRVGLWDTFETCRRYAVATLGPMGSKFSSQAGFPMPRFTEDTDEIAYREWVHFLLYSPNVFNFPEKVTRIYAYLQDPVWKELITVHLYPLINDDWVLKMMANGSCSGDGRVGDREAGLKDVSGVGRGGGGLRNDVLAETQNAQVQAMTVPAAKDEEGTPSDVNPSKKKKNNNKKKGKK